MKRKFEVYHAKGETLFEVEEIDIDNGTLWLFDRDVNRLAINITVMANHYWMQVKEITNGTN